MAERKTKSYSTQEKYYILKLLETKNQSDVAKELNISSSVVSRIVKNKEEIINAFNLGVFQTRRFKKCSNPEVADALLKWLQVTNGRESLSGPALQKKANQLAKSLNPLTTWTASYGWIARFREKYGIKYKNYHEDEINDISENGDQWIEEVSPENPMNYCEFESYFATDEPSQFSRGYTSPESGSGDLLEGHEMQEENDDFSIDLIATDDDNHAMNLQRMCTSLLDKGDFVDCTLACNDGQLQAHRVVLSSTSQYLYNLLSGTPWPTPCAHPVIMLRKSSVTDVRTALEFIYTGKVLATKHRIPALMDIARELGCSALGKAIEIAIQSCGVDMFRRLSGTKDRESQPTNSHLSASSSAPTSASDRMSNCNSNNNNSSRVKSPSNTNDIDNLIVVKAEPLDATDNSNSGSRPTSASPNQPLSSSLGVTVTPVSLSLKGQTQTLAQDTGGRSTIFNAFSRKTGDGSSEEKSTGRSETVVHLQHDKAESFVYTNEDLGMISMEPDNDTDNNESGDDDQDMLTTADININMSAVLSSVKKSDAIMGVNKPLKMEKDGETEFGGTPASCPWCMQVFTNLTLLQRHIKTHVGSYKPFVCTYCNNTFARSAHLKRHLRTHTGEKPYQCSICQRPFARQDKLKVHLERHLQNSTKNTNTSMTITSYPPPSVSQSAGGQVPIKILIPTGTNSNSMANLYNSNNSSISCSRQGQGQGQGSNLNNSGSGNSSMNFINSNNHLSENSSSTLTNNGHIHNLSGTMMKVSSSNSSATVTPIHTTTNSLLSHKLSNGKSSIPFNFVLK